MARYCRRGFGPGLRRIGVPACDGMPCEASAFCSPSLLSCIAIHSWDSAWPPCRNVANSTTSVIGREVKGAPHSWQDWRAVRISCPPGVTSATRVTRTVSVFGGIGRREHQGAGVAVLVLQGVGFRERDTETLLENA